jgi:hypothetical protein
MMELRASVTPESLYRGRLAGGAAAGSRRLGRGDDDRNHEPASVLPNSRPQAGW